MPRFTDTVVQKVVPRLHAAALALALAAPAAPAALAPGVPALAPGCPEAAGGRLTGALRGALEVDLDWHGDALACQGMPPPGRPGEGRKDHEAADRGRLWFRGPLEAAFFSSRGEASCWADVAINEPLATGGHVVAGELYCLRGLGEVGARRAVSVPALAFRGWLRPGEASPPGGPAS